MWPWSVWRRRRYERRYQAARLVMLGRYTFARLTPDERRAVMDRDRQDLQAAGAAWVRKSVDKFSLSYVVAMKSLGIPPAVAGEHWDIPEAAAAAKVFFRLYSNYRHADPATEAARLDLVARGADIPTVELLQ